MNRKDNTCCFTGHRILSNTCKAALKVLLKSEIEKLIKLNVSTFYNGGALGFDTIACEVLLEMKASYPQIQLIMILPCKNQDKKWSHNDQTKYRKILAQADKVEYISENYIPGCMQARNNLLVERSSYCICYLKNSISGTAYTVKHAKSNSLTILNLAEIS